MARTPGADRVEAAALGRAGCIGPGRTVAAGSCPPAWAAGDSRDELGCVLWVQDRFPLVKGSRGGQVARGAGTGGRAWAEVRWAVAAVTRAPGCEHGLLRLPSGRPCLPNRPAAGLLAGRAGRYSRRSAAGSNQDHPHGVVGRGCAGGCVWVPHRSAGASLGSLQGKHRSAKHDAITMAAATGATAVLPTGHRQPVPALLGCPAPPPCRPAPAGAACDDDRCRLCAGPRWLTRVASSARNIPICVPRWMIAKGRPAVPNESLFVPRGRLSHAAARRHAPGPVIRPERDTTRYHQFAVVRFRAALGPCKAALYEPLAAGLRIQDGRTGGAVFRSR